MSDFAKLTAEDDLEWYAASLGRGVEPEVLQQRLVLTNRLHDLAEDLMDAADELATFLALHLEGSSATALRVGRPDTQRAWYEFLGAVTAAAGALGLDVNGQLEPMEGNR